MNRTYELMFIVRPDMADEDLEKLISNLETTVTSASGTAARAKAAGSSGPSAPSPALRRQTAGKPPR